MSVTVIFANDTAIQTTPGEMAARSGATFPVESRVPGVPGEGFALLAWYESVAGELQGPTPTHMAVRAVDQFEAVIPWSQLATALFQYSQDGLPLPKGGPLRLYVPDGTSACLNVKSVEAIRFLADGSAGEEASYGFVQTPRRLK